MPSSDSEIFNDTKPRDLFLTAVLLVVYITSPRW